MKVERIINTIYASNTYILYDPRYDEVWLVDAGDTNLVIEWIEKYSKTLKGVFLTHTHFDHIYGLNTLYQHYPDIRVFTSPEGAEGLYSEKWNFSKYHHCSFVYAGNNVDIVRNKQTAITERKYTIPLISKILFVKLSKCPLRLNISNTFWIPPSKMLLFKRYTITSITSPITPTAAEISTFLIIV